MFDFGARFGLVFALLLGGCAEPPPAQPVSPVSVIGTPFLIALKIPACVATLAISGPAAALQQMGASTADGPQPDIRPVLDGGIDANCGPPYVVLAR